MQIYEEWALVKLTLSILAFHWYVYSRKQKRHLSSLLPLVVVISLLENMFFVWSYSFWNIFFSSAPQRTVALLHMSIWCLDRWKRIWRCRAEGRRERRKLGFGGGVGTSLISLEKCIIITGTYEHRVVQPNCGALSKNCFFRKTSLRMCTIIRNLAIFEFFAHIPKCPYT